MSLINEKSVVIDEIEFILSKFPAIAGREIIANYPLSSLPRVGDYKVNEETMLKLMSYVAVRTEAMPFLRLNSRALIDKYVPSWETLMKIEKEMIFYNCSFFQDGRASTFLNDLVQKLPELILKMSTDLLARSSQMEKQPSTN